MARKVIFFVVGLLAFAWVSYQMGPIQLLPAPAGAELLGSMPAPLTVPMSQSGHGLWPLFAALTGIVFAIWWVCQEIRAVRVPPRAKSIAQSMSVTRQPRPLAGHSVG